MIVDFDPAKDVVNRAKHGVPLVFGARVFEDCDHVVLAAFRPVDGEDRYKRSVGSTGSCGPRCLSSAAQRCD